MRQDQRAQRVDPAPRADAGQDVGELATPGAVHDRVGGGDHRRARASGQRGMGGEARIVPPVIGGACGEADRAREPPRQIRHMFGGLGCARIGGQRVRRQRDQVEAGAALFRSLARNPVEQVAPPQAAGALLRPALAACGGDGCLSVFELRAGRLMARSDPQDDELLSLALVKVSSSQRRWGHR